MTKASGTAEEQRAIAYLQWTGWLQDHDRQIYEQGKRDGVEERKTGRWIVLDECANSGFYCSNCRKKLVKEGWSNTVKKIKFCPNCGAKMEGAEK